MRSLARSLLDLVSQPRLGVEVGSTTVRAVLVMRGTILKVAAVQREKGESLDVALSAVFNSVYPTALRKPCVFVAVGPSMSQLRRLVNLPAVRDVQALREVIRGSVGRFFLKNGVPLITSFVRREGEGTGWAAALDEPPVRAVAEACRSRRLRMELAAPTVVALQHALLDETLIVADGEVTVAAFVGPNGLFHEIWRTDGLENTRNGLVATPVPALRSLGDNATAYAAPYGATQIKQGEPLAVRGREFRQWQDPTVPHWRILLALASFLVALSLALILPVLHARRVAAEAAARLAIINREYRAAHWTETELERTTESLDEIEAFRQTRRSTIEFIAELTAALPGNIWLQSLHLDQQGGSLTALAPRAALAVGAVAELKSITSPAIIGAVSTELRGPDRIERVTIRFRWKALRPSSLRAPASQQGRRL